MSRNTWAALVLSLLGVAVSAENLAVQSAAERTNADAEELAKLLAIARKSKSASREYSAELDISRHPYIGAVDAPLVMIEFGSYQCGFCRRHFAHTLPELRSAYVDTGKLRYVFFDVALDKRHQHSEIAAESAHCANEQGKFLAYRTALFGSKQVSSECLSKHAIAVGLNMAKFDRCVETGRYRAQLQADRTLSRKLQVRGTPSFFLGRQQPNGASVTVVRRIGGARSSALFSQQLDALYAELPMGRDSEVSVARPDGEWP
jgi:protein-disulfide isomerase